MGGIVRTPIEFLFLSETSQAQPWLSISYQCPALLSPQYHQTLSSAYSIIIFLWAGPPNSPKLLLQTNSKGFWTLLHTIFLDISQSVKLTTETKHPIWTHAAKLTIPHGHMLEMPIFWYHFRPITSECGSEPFWNNNSSWWISLLSAEVWRPHPSKILAPG